MPLDKTGARFILGLQIRQRGERMTQPYTSFKIILDRFRTQFKLVADMENKFTQMQSIHL